MSEVWCPNRHRLIRWEPSPACTRHEHRSYGCPMRRGNRRCGEVVIVPPLGAGCGDAREEDR